MSSQTTSGEPEVIQSDRTPVLGLERVRFGSIWREAPEKKQKTVGKHTWRYILEIFRKIKYQKLKFRYRPILEYLKG